MVVENEIIIKRDSNLISGNMIFFKTKVSPVDRISVSIVADAKTRALEKELVAISMGPKPSNRSQNCLFGLSGLSGSPQGFLGTPEIRRDLTEEKSDPNCLYTSKS